MCRQWVHASRTLSSKSPDGRLHPQQGGIHTRHLSHQINAIADQGDPSFENSSILLCKSNTRLSFTTTCFRLEFLDPFRGTCLG